MSPDFMNALLQHGWKGNVRELKNVIERTVILADQETLTPNLLPYDFNAFPDGREFARSSIRRKSPHSKNTFTRTGK